MCVMVEWCPVILQASLSSPLPFHLYMYILLSWAPIPTRLLSAENLISLISLSETLMILFCLRSGVKTRRVPSLHPTRM